MTIGSPHCEATPGLCGIHWYSTAASATGLVEEMTGGRPCWVLENVMTNEDVAQIWQLIPWRNENIIKPFQQKGHTPLIRLQPYWGVNVPHQDDPYSLSDFARDATAAANRAKNVTFWQVGNEVNIAGENIRWNPTDNNYSGAQWQPSAAQYATTYLSIRDAIHEVTPDNNEPQTVLMEPVSPGAADAARNVDGYDFLFDTLNSMTEAEREKVDGFAIHAYAPVGAPNNGVNDFMETVNRQLTIIDGFGMGARPVFITEWNMHMPTADAARNAARFIPAAMQALNQQNLVVGSLWPRRQPHTVTGAMWFVYPKDSDNIADGWNAWSLEFWKGKTGDTTAAGDPWVAYQKVFSSDYQTGVPGNIIELKSTELWAADEFGHAAGNVTDSYAPVPAWKADCANGGAATYTGDGWLKLAGNSQWASSGIMTKANAFADFRLTTAFKIVNSAAVPNVPEANTEIRFRENDCGSHGYSLTFFTDQSGANTNKIMLRETGSWNTIGECEQTVGSGIKTGDDVVVDVIAKGDDIKIKVTRKDSAETLVNWSIKDSRFRVGGIRLMNYCMLEIRYDYVRIGGSERPDDDISSVNNWE
ncbi:hypothetical protein GX645_02940 [Candidatus Sumerlaeota bacterium]|nr:hypothetical protein [Candidatus Sumerlaeota bacterium]